MVKSIIKRIIVGVGIALCLMYIKDGSLIGQVQAMTVDNLVPVSFYSVNENGNLTTFTLQTFTHQYIRTDFYGGKVGSSNLSTMYMFWGFGTSNIDISQPLDINFLLWGSSFTNDSPPYRVWINDPNGNQIPCQTQSSIGVIGNQTSSPTNTITPVQCSNVALTGKNYFRVYVGDDFGMQHDQYYGISKLTLYPHSSNQAVQNAINENTQAVENVNDSLNDQSDANTSGFLQDINQDYSNNPVSDLITMPITFLQRLNNNVSGSCITWNLGSLLGTNLTMPCINLSNILGSWLYNLIDMAICLFLAYNIGLMCVTIWNNMTSLKDDFDDMYSPRHAYNGKHTGGDS